jgi:RHS repeat-associated protein
VATVTGRANAIQYVYALGTRPLAQYGADWEYLLADARPCPTLQRSVGGPLGVGSVRQIVDANGNVTLAESYEPYGSVLSSNGTASSIFGYSGEQIDTYIKLLFLRARYYSPETARFLSKDVWQGDYIRPQSLNAWAYVEDDPVNATDPSGRFKLCTPPWKWMAEYVAHSIIKDQPTAGERLFRLFEDDFDECNAWLCAGLNAADRLDFVLDYTQGFATNVPAPGFPAQFRINFGGDDGLAEELRDSKYYETWGGTTNQPGHFLTAVALAYRGPGRFSHLLFWPRQDTEPFLTTDDRIALGLIVGHEMVPDNAGNFYYAPQLQFYKASIQDIQLFLSALAAEIRGDLTARDDYFWQILGSDYDETQRVGNSIEDLRLSAKGWNFGKWVLAHKGVSHIIAGAWLRNNIGQ